MPKLTPVDIWDIAASALHSEDYCKTYAKYLTKIIGSKEKSILDTASGTGFPSITLFREGYNKITCLNTNEKEMKLLRKRFEKEDINFSVIKKRWQTLELKEKFDVVLNLDNSLVYIDSWSSLKNFDGRRAFERILIVLKNFYKLLDKNGILIVALAKNSVKNYPELKLCIGDATFGNKKANVIFDITYDIKNTTKTANIKVKIGNEIFERPVKSYLITKEELADLMRTAGFRVKIITTHGLYDNLLIGRK